MTGSKTPVRQWRVYKVAGPDVERYLVLVTDHEDAKLQKHRLWASSEWEAVWLMDTLNASTREAELVKDADRLAEALLSSKASCRCEYGSCLNCAESDMALAAHVALTRTRPAQEGS